MGETEVMRTCRSRFGAPPPPTQWSLQRLSCAQHADLPCRPHPPPPTPHPQNLHRVQGDAVPLGQSGPQQRSEGAACSHRTACPPAAAPLSLARSGEFESCVSGALQGAPADSLRSAPPPAAGCAPPPRTAYAGVRTMPCSLVRPEGTCKRGPEAVRRGAKGQMVRTPLSCGRGHGSNHKQRGSICAACYFYGGLTWNGLAFTSSQNAP